MDAWQMPTMQGFHNHTSIVGPLANPAPATIKHFPHTFRGRSREPPDFLLQLSSASLEAPLILRYDNTS